MTDHSSPGTPAPRELRSTPPKIEITFLGGIDPEPLNRIRGLSQQIATGFMKDSGLAELTRVSEQVARQLGPIRELGLRWSSLVTPKIEITFLGGLRAGVAEGAPARAH